MLSLMVYLESCMTGLIIMVVVDIKHKKMKYL